MSGWYYEDVRSKKRRKFMRNKRTNVGWSQTIKEFTLEFILEGKGKLLK